jgi:hypothetical protein
MCRPTRREPVRAGVTRTLHCPLLTLLVVALVAAPPAAAQAVRGTITEHPAGTALPRAAVALLDSTGTAVDSTRSSAQGAFSLRAPAAGEYILYFTHPGYASVPSGWLRLDEGQTVQHAFTVPLVSGAAIARMSQVLTAEKRLQTDLSELCGARPNLTDAGILVGVVRRRGTNEPLAGATVRVDVPARGGRPAYQRTVVTSANGVYVMCEVPAGTAATRTELAGYRVDEGPVEVRAGDAAWYDMLLRPL